jgi:cytochrome b involved in lipid metabolism
MNKVFAIIAIFSVLAVSAGVGVFMFSAENREVFEAVSTTSMEENSQTSSIEEKCLIKVDNDTYDVSEFRRKHPGGDIFKCGQDMTNAFYSQHGAKQLREIQKYKVSPEELQEPQENVSPEETSAN